MLNLYGTTIESLYIHKVGNKSRYEGVFLAKEETELTDELRPLIKEFMLKPFRSKEENYFKFSHEVDVEYNEMYSWAKNFFSPPAMTADMMKQFTELVANRLYEQSSHPHIKSGEVYICHLKDMLIDEMRVDGIGIFKSEIKQDFLQFVKEDNKLEVILTQGVNLGKLDKGVIIFNTEAAEGYKILSVDQNRYDTKYWLDNFLGVVEFEDSKFHTKKYLKMSQDFAKDVVLPAEDKKESVMFVNEAFNYMASIDKFNEQDYMNNFRNPDLVPEFQNYKTEKGPKYSIQDLSTFDVDNTAVKESQKKWKSTIELDTNITIKLGFVNTESADKFLEKGWDEERQMYYYLCYFNKETK